MRDYFGAVNAPLGIGAVLKGWDITESDFRNPEKLPVIDFRGMTADCPHNCRHCFTDKSIQTLSLKEVKGIQSELAELGAHGIAYLGEGEPTLDKNFFPIIEHAASLGIQPIVFTDGATKLRDPEFAERLYATGASVCLKCDSLYDPEYQNWLVNDPTEKFFDQRNESLTLLRSIGFNRVGEDGTTRLGLEMVVSTKNAKDVEQTLRFSRSNNLRVVFSCFLPTGRSGREDFDKSLTLPEGEWKRIRRRITQIDAEEYSFHHPEFNNYVTAPCVEFLQICGDGRVTPCPANDEIIGNVKTEPLAPMIKRVLQKFPGHCRKASTGNCLYRPK